MRAWAWSACAALLAALAMFALSIGITRHALNVAAAREAGHYAAGITPWYWQLRAPDDVVAGRAFGPASLSKSSDGLIATSDNGTRYAVGLPMTRPADFKRFPRLHLDAASASGFHLRFSLRQHLRGDLLVSSDMAIPGGSHAIDVNLASLTWHGTNGASIKPERAAMLRLLIQQAAGTTLRLHDAAVLPQSSTPLGVALPPDMVAPHNLANLRAMLERLGRRTANDAVPTILLSHLSTAGAMLRQRDRIHEWLPAAVVAASASWRDIAGPSHALPRWSAWFGLLVYAALLLALVLRPSHHPRWRAACEIAACSAPPLAWAIGLGGARAAPMAWAAAVALALVFACVLAWRQQDHTWHWAEAAWRTWALPALAIVAAALFLLAWRAIPHLPPPHRLLLYLVWALVQQLMMLVVIAPRLQQLAHSRAWAIIGTALLFALMHTPNGCLMQLTFVAELWWTWCFLRRPALVPVAVAHALAALLLGGALGALPLRSLDVGAAFLR